MALPRPPSNWGTTSLGFVNNQQPGIDVEGKTVQDIEPDYYKFTLSNVKLEVLDIIEAFNLNFSLGSVVKYVLRAGRKTPDRIEDLKKARTFLNREIARLEKC